MKKVTPWVIIILLVIALAASNSSAIKSKLDTATETTQPKIQSEKSVDDERIVGEWWAAYSAMNESHTLKFISGGMGYDLFEEEPSYEPFEWYSCGDNILVKYESSGWQIYFCEYSEDEGDYVLTQQGSNISFRKIS